jgi:type IV pilus assembly protein PilY1
MAYKISGRNPEDVRILTFNESDWSLEDNTVVSGVYTYEITSLASGTKSVIARNSEGEISGFGGITPTYVAPTDVDATYTVVGTYNDGQVRTDGPYYTATGGTHAVTDHPTHMWLRFTTGVEIPQGATVNSAVLKLYSAYNSFASDHVARIRGNDTDVAAYPTDASDFSSKVKTSTSVDWTLPQQWDNGAAVTSPDISTVVQEIVDRAGFNPSGGLQFFLYYISGNGNKYYASADHGSYSAGQLVINYTPA